MEKLCSYCHQYKNVSEFTKMGKGFQSRCKSCNREYLKKYNPKYYDANKIKIANNGISYRKQVLEWYKDYKSNLKCSQCNENHPSCLEFHHLDPKNKKFNIGNSYAKYSKETILEEMNKCIILCSNCHKKLHYIE